MKNKKMNFSLYFNLYGGHLMNMTRREFILLSASIFLTASTYPKLSLRNNSTVHNIILGGGSYLNLDNLERKHVISVIDLESRKRTLTDISFLPHGFHRNPQNINRLAIFEKRGPGACEYDLNERKVVRYIPGASGRYFYGHGAYSIDGSLLYSTETMLKTKDGVIALRDADTLKILGEFPSYGKEPHECKLIDGGQTMVVTNGGGNMQGETPNVAYIDMNSEKLLEKVELTNARLNTGHFSVSDTGSLVVVSAPREGLSNQHLGGVSIRPRGDYMESIASPLAVTQRMKGEALSVVIHPDAGLAAVTHPDSNMVTIWSLHDRKLVKVIELEKARGVELTSDMKSFVISYGFQASLIQIPLATLEPDNDSIIEDSLISGSHIYNWSREMNELFYPGPLV
jgi:hypothetical protein